MASGRARPPGTPPTAGEYLSRPSTGEEGALSAEDPGRSEERRARPAPRPGGQRGISVGRILGIEISLDYSWFILFFLIFWSFSQWAFPAQIPGLDTRTYLLMGAAGTLLFFASLLGHELSHSLVAQAKGIEMEGITLFVFGGMARTSREADSPGEEFQIAGVGPLSSFAFAAAFWGMEMLAESRGWSPAVAGVARYMAFLNLALAIFNLFPGFPLDGGRLLRAGLWRATGSLRRATRVAATAGQWLGYGLMGLGILGLFTGAGAVSALWFIFIGWFLSNAATASYRQVLLKEVLGDVSAQEAMTPDPETVAPDLSLDVLVNDHFLKRPYNAFPVTEDGIAVGMITLSQVKEVPRDRWGETRVADVMSPLEETLIVTPDSPMTEVLRRMGENDTQRVLVAREWELLGIISARDVTHWLERAELTPEEPG